MTTPGTSRLTLVGRLLLAQMIVVVVALALSWMATAAYGPAVFRYRLQRSGIGLSPGAVDRVSRAFHFTNLLDAGIAVLIALVIAFSLSIVLSRVVNRSIGTLADAAEQVSAGRYAARVPPSALGPEMNRLSESFNRMAAQLQSVEATRRRLLADLAHELRTPIATLDGYLEGMQDGVTKPDEATLQMLRRQTGRMARLVDDIAAVSALEEHQFRLSLAPMRLDDLVTTAVAAARAVAASRYSDKSITLRQVVDPDLPTIQVDRERLEQALGNLLTNALRHSRPGGVITVRARAANDAVELCVHDDGDGIAAEHLPHLFERFYRTDPARDRDSGGSGIGLTITNAIVNAHNGRLTADSPGLGQGSTFTIRLPAR